MPAAALSFPPDSFLYAANRYREVALAEVCFRQAGSGAARRAGWRGSRFSGPIGSAKFPKRLISVNALLIIFYEGKDHSLRVDSDFRTEQFGDFDMRQRGRNPIDEAVCRLRDQGVERHNLRPSRSGSHPGDRLRRQADRLSGAER